MSLHKKYKQYLTKYCVNKIYSGIFFLIILIGSGIISGSFMNLVEGQSPSTETNVTDLTRSDVSNAGVKLENRTVDYYDQAKGYLVYPITPNENQSTSNNTLPAVVMIHENKGLNDNIKNMANLLAKSGYVVLAVDLFKGEVTTDRNRSSELTQEVRDNQDIATANLKSAVKYLASLPNVNAEKIVSLGWCFGGAQSLQLSSEQPRSSASSYYHILWPSDNRQCNPCEHKVACTWHIWRSR